WLLAVEQSGAVTPSHGKNRGSSPLGSANNFKVLDRGDVRVQRLSNKRLLHTQRLIVPLPCTCPMEANGRWPVPGLPRSPCNHRTIVVVNLSRARESRRLDYI